MKKIGLLAGLQGSVFGVTIPYYEYMKQFGDIVLINPLSEFINTDIDLLILVGGADLDPLSYNEQPSLHTNKSNPVRTWFDSKMLPQYITAKIPIFGICLGLQSIVAHFGGKLIQHNSTYHPFSDNYREETVHEITITKAALRDTRFPFLKGISKLKENIKVNSLHHQSANKNSLGIGLKTHFYTNEYDETPEVIVHETLPIVTVQYHPENQEGLPSQFLATSYINKLLNL